MFRRLLAAAASAFGGKAAGSKDLTGDHEPLVLDLPDDEPSTLDLPALGAPTAATGDDGIPDVSSLRPGSETHTPVSAASPDLVIEWVDDPFGSK